jgi:hypothetical protein
MSSIIFGLSLVGAVVGLSANGVSTVPMYSASATPTAVDSSYGQYGAAYQAPAYQAPPSQYTPPPSYSATPYYDQMPYSSMMEGGYKSLNCGYGYKKDEDGHCMPEDWVNRILFSAFFVYLLTFSGSGRTIRRGVMNNSWSITSMWKNLC